MRIWIAIVGISVVLASGCCTPIGCGIGCNALEGCFDCEGGFGPPRIPCGPLDGLRQAKRSLVCGRGCGEVYYGEWMSTPPDCCDPCCGDQFVGGAVRCTPLCWEPGALLRKLYGQRLCACCDSWGDACGCEGGDAGSGIAIESNTVGCDCGSAHGAALTHRSPPRQPSGPIPQSTAPPRTVVAKPLAPGQRVTTPLPKPTPAPAPAQPRQLR